MGGESRLIFVTAYPCSSMILRKRYLINSCIPCEWETAPSLGVRLVNASRKREEKPGRMNRTIRTAEKTTMGKTFEGALRRRHARASQNPARRRKTLVVGRSCHHDIQYGRYDGPKLSK